MAVTVVVGMQWGDEAKGKVVDLLAKDYDYVVRFNGGDNAGHTIKVGDKKFALHLLPCGIFYPDKIKVIGNGVVINPETLMKEISTVEAAGCRVSNLMISESAHIILPWHRMLDSIEDEKNAIGTTKRGIGPTFMDKAARFSAIRMCDISDEKNLEEKLARIAKIKEKLLSSYGIKIEFQIPELSRNLKTFSEKTRALVKNTSYVLNRAIDEKQNILLEGAQGTLLDIDHGTYPYVTSSNTIAASACIGSGIPTTKITKIIGVTKAYTTRVGAGPFPTELADAMGEHLRQKGGEFGATTGRPRRCGWLDLVVLKYSTMINGIHELAVTKLDVLGGLDEIKVCTAYEIGGKKITEFPVNTSLLARATPIYKVFKGWKDISKEEWGQAVKTRKLPKEAAAYLGFISKELNVTISLVSFGPERSETIFL